MYMLRDCCIQHELLEHFEKQSPHNLLSIVCSVD